MPARVNPETPRMTDVETLRGAARLLMALDSFLAHQVGGITDRLAASQQEVERLTQENMALGTENRMLWGDTECLRAQLAAAREDGARWQKIKPFLCALYVGTGTWQIGFADEHDELMANVPRTSSFARSPHDATVDEVIDAIDTARSTDAERGETT